MFGGRWLRYFEGSVGSWRHIISSERGSSGISVDLLPRGIHFVAAIEELMQLEQRHRKLMQVNRELVSELQKFKQLNGKSK